MPEFDPTEIDALVDAVIEKLRGLSGEPDLERRPAIGPRLEQLSELIPVRRLGIAGMELTQSIQHHGAAGPSYGADNSVPLVALKTLVVRVYPHLRQGFSRSDSSSTERVTGELIVSNGEQVVFRTGPTRQGGARVGRQADLDRSLWDREVTAVIPDSRFAVELTHLHPPLNFIVPAWVCRRGRCHIAVRIWPVDQGPGSTMSANASHYAEFLNVAAPRVALVRVNWDDGMGTVTSPTDADMLETIRLAERMLPFPYFETTILGIEVEESGNFAALATDGGCNTEWENLLATLNWTRVWTSLFQLGDLVYGMVPQAAIPPGSGKINSGCGDANQAAAGFVGLPRTFAHELGHCFSRNHVAVPNDDDNDPDYPRYGGHARSIGEVGIDTGTSPPTLYAPAQSDDIMSYGRNKWISPYTYQAFLAARGDHQSAPADVRRVRPFLLLDLRLHRTAEGLSRLEVRQAARVDAPGGAPTLRTPAAVSPISVDFLAADGRILATHHCRYVRKHAGGCGCCGSSGVPYDREPYIDMHEAIEWPGEGVATIAFNRGRAPIAELRVGEPPRVDAGAVEIESGRLRTRISAEHPREQPSVAVLFSGDDGVSWQPVAFNPREGNVSVPVDHLPSSGRCRIRAIATAELQSVTADSDPFELPLARPRLHVVVPSAACDIDPGPVAMHVLVDTRGLGGVSLDDVRWRSSLQGEIGTGLNVVADLEHGEHEIVVSAPDGVGGVISERAIIVVGGKPLPGLG